MFSLKLLRNSVLYFSSQFIVAVIGFITIPILTTYLTPEEYGMIGMYMIFIMFIEQLIGISIPSSTYVNFFKLSPETFSKYLSNCLLLLLINALLIFILIVAFHSFLFDKIGLPFLWLGIATLVAFFKNLSSMNTQLWIARSKSKNYAIFEILQAIFIALLSILLVVLLNYGWEGRLYGISISIVLFGTFSYCYLHKIQTIQYNYAKRDDWKDALMFGIPLIPHTLGGFIIQSTDRFLLNELIDLSSVGIYMIALQFGLAMSMITSTIPKVFSPWLMKNLATPTINKRKVVAVTYLTMLCLIVIAIIISYMIKFALPFIIDNKYLGAMNIILYICLAHAFTGCYYLITSYIFYTKRTRPLAILTFSCAIINIPLTYTLIIYNGLSGAAQAFMITHIIFFITAWIVSNRIYPMPWLLFANKIKPDTD